MGPPHPALQIHEPSRRQVGLPHHRASLRPLRSALATPWLLVSSSGGGRPWRVIPKPVLETLIHNHALRPLVLHQPRGSPTRTRPTAGAALGDPHHCDSTTPRALPDAAPSAVSDPVGAVLVDPDAASPLALCHIILGIAGAAHLWSRRREYVRLWWDPATMRSHVRLNAGAPAAPGPVPPGRDPSRRSGLEDTSRFWDTNPMGHPSGLQIARIAAEGVRLVGDEGTRSVVLVDDDTMLCADAHPRSPVLPPLTTPLPGPVVAASSLPAKTTSSLSSSTPRFAYAQHGMHRGGNATLGGDLNARTESTDGEAWRRPDLDIDTAAAAVFSTAAAAITRCLDESD